MSNFKIRRFLPYVYEKQDARTSPSTRWPFYFPANTVIEHLRSEDLDTFVNAVQPIVAGVLTRHREADDRLEMGDAGYTKFGRVGNFNAGNDGPNTNLGQWGDDVVILGMVKDLDGNFGAEWVLFWYDTNHDECSISRWTTEDDRATVIRNFMTWAQGRSVLLAREVGPVHWLDVRNFSGRIRYGHLHGRSM